jgi:hypothetical protein
MISVTIEVSSIVPCNFTCFPDYQLVTTTNHRRTTDYSGKSLIKDRNIDQVILSKSSSKFAVRSIANDLASSLATI